MILILTRMFNPVHNLRKMNRYKIYAAKYSSIVLAVIAVALACGACTNQGGRASGGDTDSIGVTQRPDTLLIDLAHSIAGSDASGFAARCSYPITREYPLRDIVDSAGMVRYFPVIFDDSLKSAFARMTPGDWESYGWRGWSPKENNELWVDDKVYAVNYHSKAENALRAMLADEEIASIAPELRGGWVPSFCLHDALDSTIYRVDFQAAEQPAYDDEADARPAAGRYRMSVYPPGSDLHMIPARMLTGSLEVEGSAGIRTYSFAASDGTSVTYSPDEAQPTLRIASGDSIREHPVSRVYWRDYVATPR